MTFFDFISQFFVLFIPQVTFFDFISQFFFLKFLLIFLLIGLLSCNFDALSHNCEFISDLFSHNC